MAQTLDRMTQFCSFLDSIKSHISKKAELISPKNKTQNYVFFKEKHWFYNTCFWIFATRYIYKNNFSTRICCFKMISSNLIQIIKSKFTEVNLAESNSRWRKANFIALSHQNVSIINKNICEIFYKAPKICKKASLLIDFEIWIDLKTLDFFLRIGHFIAIVHVCACAVVQMMFFEAFRLQFEPVTCNYSESVAKLKYEQIWRAMAIRKCSFVQT